MSAISAFAEHYAVVLLMKNANHSIGSRYQGGPVGNWYYNLIAEFSFRPVKIINIGEGCLATISYPVPVRRMAGMHCYCIVRETDRFTGPWMYEQQQLGFFSAPGIACGSACAVAGGARGRA